MTETSAGRYRASLAFAGANDRAAAPVQMRLSALNLSSLSLPLLTRQRPTQPSAVTAQTPGGAGQWRTDPERLYSVGAEDAALLHGLHEVRLGGPNLAEPVAGTLLAVSGQQRRTLRGGHGSAVGAHLQVVREVTAEQAGPGRVQLRITLQQPRLWGWRVEHTAGALRITVRPG